MRGCQSGVAWGWRQTQHLAKTQWLASCVLWSQRWRSQAREVAGGDHMSIQQRWQEHTSEAQRQIPVERHLEYWEWVREGAVSKDGSSSTQCTVLRRKYKHAFILHLSERWREKKTNYGRWCHKRVTRNAKQSLWLDFFFPICFSLLKNHPFLPIKRTNKWALSLVYPARSEE